VFPPPLGPWLHRGKPGNFHGTLRKHRVTPAGLLHSWLVKYPFRLKVETWTKTQIKKRFDSWPGHVQEIYNRDRVAFAELITIKGKLSEASRLTCGRYGAWRAMLALEVATMPMSVFSWAGLSVSMGGPGTLVSDNYQGPTHGPGPVYAAREAMLLLKVGPGARAITADVKAVFADRGTTVRSVRDMPESQPEDPRRPEFIHIWPEKYRKRA